MQSTTSSTAAATTAATAATTTTAVSQYLSYETVYLTNVKAIDL